MTAIVGVESQGVVVLGGDSIAIDGLSANRASEPKVFFNDTVLIGFCGSFRMGNLLQHALRVPKHPARMQDEKYLVTRFIDAVRECFTTGGFAWTDGGQEQGGLFLIGYRGRLYRVDTDFHVSRPAEGYAAIGVGAAIAHGALHAIQAMKAQGLAEVTVAEEEVEMALQAAQHFSAGVWEPFVILTQYPHGGGSR